jgi:hypothetical protein
MAEQTPNAGSGAGESKSPSVRPPDDQEEVYFEGAPSLKGEVGMLVVCGLIAVGLLVVAIVVGVFTGPVGFLVGTPVALLLGAAAFLYPVIVCRFKRYKITSYRIDFERGLLSKTIDTLELWHVEDIRFHQSMWDRILKVGTLTVVGNDDTSPNMIMKGLPDPRRLFDVLKSRVIAVKRQRGVLKLDT